jgi:hypothetical protein
MKKMNKCTAKFHILILLPFICSNGLASSIGASGLARLRITRAGYDPIVIRAVDRAGLLSIRAREHMRHASFALAWIHMARIRAKYVAVYGTDEDKVRQARCKARRKESGLAEIDRARKMVINLYTRSRHVVVRR